MVEQLDIVGRAVRADRVDSMERGNGMDGDTLSVLSLNVCGLANRLSCPLFVEEILRYRIVLFQETKTDAVDNVSIQNFCKENNFTCFIKSRVLCKRKSGGLVTMFKNEIVSLAKEITLESDLLQCFVIDKSILKATDDLLLCNVYIPPRTSAYSYLDDFEEIERSLIRESYAEKMTLLCGDFNSHTNTVVDYVDTDDLRSDELNVLNVREYLESINCLTRKNEDTRQIDRYGRKLIGTLRDLGLCILNGRVRGDKMGKATTSHNSVIDYFIGSPMIINYIARIEIDDYDNIFSDIHSKMSLYFDSVSINVYNNGKNQ